MGARRFDVTFLFAEDGGIPEEAPSEVRRKVPSISGWASRGRDEPRERKRRTKTVAACTFERSAEEVEEAIRTGDWSGAHAAHFVALYARLHKVVYEVEPGDLGPRERYKAAMMAAGLLKNRFGGDGLKMFEFMRWCWEREEEREDWRRENARDGRRLHWTLQFGTKLLPDYELAVLRGATSR